MTFLKNYTGTFADMIAMHNKWFARRPRASSFYKRRVCAKLTLAALLLLLLPTVGCDRLENAQPGAAPQVRLDKLTPLPARETVPEENLLKVAVAAILSPQGNVQSYRPLLDLLGDRMGKTVQLVQRRTYLEINDLLARGVVDLAFICTGAYMEGERQEIMSLLVVPQINGKITYKALLIVSAESEYTSLANLRGKSFAFTDPMSNTGYLCPVNELKKKGEQPETFFSSFIFTHSHERSIAAVMEGLVCCASVDNLVYENAKTRNSEIREKTRVIWESEEFGMPPVVVPKQIPPELKEKLLAFFLTIHEEQAGKTALGKLAIDRFVVPPEELYTRQ